MFTKRLFAPLLAATLATATLAARCGDAGEAQVSGGDVLLSDTTTLAALDYPVTSDTYRRWLAANDNLDRLGYEPQLRIDPRRATEDDVARVAAELEQHPEGRVAIETANLSVRDYVATSVALAQSYDVAHDSRTPLRDVRPENVAFIRSVDNDTPVVRSRPRARFFQDDSDSDSDSDGDGRGKKKGKKGKGKGNRD